MKRTMIVAAGAVLLSGGLLFPVPAGAASATACSLVAPDTAALLQQAPVVQAIVGLPSVDPKVIQDARDHLGCGAPPVRTAAEAKAAVCAVLTTSGVTEVLNETNANNTIRSLVTANRNAEGLILTQARQQLRCDPSTTTTSPPTGTTSAPPQIAIVPKGPAQTGA